MAWTQADLDAVRKAIASGMQMVRFSDGREVRYQTADHLLAVERTINTQLTLAAREAVGATRRKFGAFRSGF